MSIRAKIEAIIYAAEEPVTLAQMAALLGGEAEEMLAAEAAAAPAPEEEAQAEASSETPAEELAAAMQESSESELFAAEKRAAKDKDRRIRDVLRREADALIAEYAATDRGMEVREVAGGYRMATKPEYHDIVRGFVKSLKPPMKLTLQALETLAVIAYKQPVTVREISEIRGVDSSGVLGSLISRKLITTAGRKQVIGRPILYKTTKDFLMRFGLKDIGDLPSIEEFAQMAGELAEQDALPIVDESAAVAELENPTESESATEQETELTDAE